MTEAEISIFSSLHDGGFDSWEGTSGSLRLSIGCQYLASRIDPHFTKFILELGDITLLTLDCWTQDFSSKVLTTPAEIFGGMLEVIAATRGASGIAEITCYQSDPALDYVGGNMHLQCGSIRLFDELGQELTATELEAISVSYWNDFGK